MLYSKIRRNGLKKGENRKVGLLDAYFETAKEIMEHYPYLKKWERVMQYNCLIALTHGAVNSSDALFAIAQALGVPEAYSNCVLAPCTDFAR